MKIRIVAIACLAFTSLLLVGVLHADQQAPKAGAPEFIAMDVIVDSGSASLAAYQIEYIGGAGVQLVGVEGGEHAAFAPPPAYDPAALNQNRIIIAAYDTSADLPGGRTRVARLHLLCETPPVGLRTDLRVHAAVNAAGEDIEIEATIIPHEGTE